MLPNQLKLEAFSQQMEALFSTPTEKQVRYFVDLGYMPLTDAQARVVNGIVQSRKSLRRYPCCALAITVSSRTGIALAKFPDQHVWLAPTGRVLKLIVAEGLGS